MTATITPVGLTIQITCPVEHGCALLTEADLIGQPEVRKYVQRFPDSWRYDATKKLYRCPVDLDAQEAGEAVFYIRAEAHR